MPMKSLLAREMSKQNESKRRSPSIIARLMGLDGLSPQSSSHKQHKSLENHQSRRRACEQAHGYDGDRSSRRGSKDEQEFRDVFEVLDARVESGGNLYRGRGNTNLTEAEMAFIRQKFMETKRLSTDGKLHHSKEFSDALEDLDSNKDLLLRFLQNPDSLFTKHLHDLQSIDRKPHCIQEKLVEKSVMQPTEIVVMKPKLGKTRNAGRTLSSQSSSDEFRADHRLPWTSNRDSDAYDRHKAYKDVSLSRHKTRESREIGKRVTRQVKRTRARAGSMNFETSGFRGYAGDESSSGSDSTSGSELVPSAARTRNRYLSSGSTESSVSREAKRRMSRRWKLAQKSEQGREMCRSSTLAEMLAISDRKARPASFNGLSKRFENNIGQSDLPEPSGISSRDGWKGASTRNSAKPGTIMNQESSSYYKIVIPKETINRNGLAKRSFHYGEVRLKLIGNSRPSSDNKSRLSSNTSPEINICSSSNKILYMDGRVFGQKLPALKAHSGFSADADSDNENGSNFEDTKTTLSSESPNLPASTPLTDPEVNQSSVSELQSCENTKEGDQPSPVSVLEASFRDDFSSSSECFESIHADLQGLRMQLQLLKLESGAMLVSSDEDADHEESSSSRLTNEKMINRASPQDWKSLYLADVLTFSRFSDSNPDTFMARWHSTDSPVNPFLFEELEKKYSDLKPSTRIERKFLFDRINEEILQIFKRVKPSRICLDMNGIQETLYDLVVNKDEKKSGEEAEEKVLDEWKWLRFGDDIEAIGREIEKMLTDELIAEVML
ncbi:PREDICTED: uncharacterized protein LOC104805416 isoform X2 [Tarenaya hassleriana]|uniref:uncharacterized protein LOC104805416 isoform X2 n=1 Tax=Tarenaya hassleriana TaxID=28532 RepID=UPI00053C806A|nr:PREDICTED: uncharacterized protein LOC104805416 isoform X2 [Tarenaya hassleriana]